MSILLGCIADDFTGASDLAGILARSKVPVNLRLGVPNEPAADDTPAPFEIIALKCRTSPIADALSDVLAAHTWLASHNSQRYFWKYCSTFDSTADGNIGPVSEALMQAINSQGDNPANKLSDTTLYCPAFPENGRSVYMSNLYVGNQPLAESAMKDHPLTPMTDSNLIRLLSKQVPNPVTAIEWPIIKKGPDAIRDALHQHHANGIRHIIVDAIDDNDLLNIVRASEHLALLTGGSALAMHLPALFRIRGWLSEHENTEKPLVPKGRQLVLSGSCSEMTQQQVAYHQTQANGFKIDPISLSRDNQLETAIQWLRDPDNRNSAPLIYATADPTAVARSHSELGRQQAGDIVEHALATLAVEAFELGVRQFVIAGGETSGAVARALGLHSLRVGSEIAPGVPWTFGQRHKQPLAIALKSGNFGDAEFFSQAFNHLNAA